MIFDLEQAPVPRSFDCDIAIVGAGAMGITMAAELAASGHDTILLEAGGQSLESASQDLFRVARSVGRPLPGLHSGRYRMLGGTTNFWGGQLVRFDPVVFEHRPWLPYSGWPFGRETLDPYYDRTLDLLGMECQTEDGEVWRRLGIQAPEFGPELDVFLTRWLPNPNLAQVFRNTLEGDKLRTLVHANVVALDPGANPESPFTLRLRTIEGRQATVCARRVVLACGTVEIVRLLMQPGANGVALPWNSMPWLGQGFADHVDCDAGTVVPIDKKAFHHLFDNIYLNGYKYNPKIKLADDAQRREKKLGISAQFAFLSDYGEHLANLKMFVRAMLSGRKPRDLSKLPKHASALWKVGLPLAMRYLHSNRAFNPTDRGILLRLTAEQFPNRASRIGLTEERDRLGLPIVEVEWRLDGRELDTLASFADRLNARLQARGLARIDLHPDLAARNPAFLETIDDGYHQMGGARIGASRDDGVVDANLRVHGAGRLYVAGAAVFPSTGFPNPTFTAMALGLRLADHLRGRA